MENTEKLAFLRSVFGRGVVSSSGINLAVKCPNPKCDSRLSDKFKFSIRLDTDQSHCWVCGLKTRGSLLRALRMASVSANVIQEYVDRYQVKASALPLSEVESQEKSLDFPKDFKMLAVHQNSIDPDIRSALSYLRRRGLSERDLWYFKLGVSNELKFKRRVIMPSFDSEGRLNYFTARSLDEKPWIKYLNPDVDKVPVIFNECNIDWKQEITVVEGPFDLVKCDENATCLQGSGFTEDYLLFWRVIQHQTPVVLALDLDAYKKTQMYARLLSSYGIQVRMLDVSGFKDVGEMTSVEFSQRKAQAAPWCAMNAMRQRIDALTNRVAC